MENKTVDEKIKELSKAELRRLLTNAIIIMSVEGYPQADPESVLKRLKEYK